MWSRAGTDAPPSAVRGVCVTMTRVTTLERPYRITPAGLPDHPDHRGHRRHATYRQVVAAHLAAVDPVVRKLMENGWSEVVVDPEIDCEAPALPEALNLVATAPPGTPLGRALSCGVTVSGEPVSGTVRAAIRIVLDRAAQVRDVHMLLGSAAVSARADVVAQRFGRRVDVAVLAAPTFADDAASFLRVHRLTVNELLPAG